MPIYEYLCSECNTLMEALIRTERDNKDLCCENCGSKRLTKKMSAPSSLVSKKGDPKCGMESPCCQMPGTPPCSHASCDHSH